MAAASDPGPANRGTAVRAETYLRLLAETELRAALALPRLATRRGRVRGRAAESPQADQALQRLEYVAAAFAAAGAVDENVADSVTDGLALALAVRHKMDLAVLSWRAGPMWRSWKRVAAPAGAYRAAALAVTIGVETQGTAADLHLRALVLAPDRCVIMAAGRPPEPHGRPGPGTHAMMPFGDLAGTATDDRGGSYQLGNDAASWSDDAWTGSFGLRPVPPPGTRWLDLVMAAGQQPIRVPLPAVPASSPDPGPALACSAGGAEQLIDKAADGFAAGLTAGMASASDIFAELWPVVRGLQAAGVLATASPAVGRLVTLARLISADVPAELRQLPAAELPERWQYAASHHGPRWEGTAGFAPAAAVLPEIDGTRCVLAGLTSDGHCATLDILAWGWPHPRHGRRPFGHLQERFTLWGRDDAGRWYGCTESGGGFSDRHADLRFNLHPAPHPEARELEIFLSGAAGEVSATVPLDWRPLP